MRVEGFSLGGHEIKVVYKRTVRCPETGEEVFGLADWVVGTIYVATHLKGRKLSEDVLDQSFFHELAHCIMMIMNETELNTNESFIDAVGTYNHQFFKSIRIKK